MPELPEVEQVRKTLLPHIKGKTITKVEVYLDRLVKHPSSEQFIKNLTGRTIEDVLPSRKVSGAENRCQSKTYRAFTYDRVFGGTG